jgi:carboxyvinyl-carboxyphosphonate phosphorylmutase
MSWTERRQNFRTLLAGDTCTYPISVFDPMTARMAAELNFDMAMLAGSVAAMTVAAAPDRILITATEFSDLAHRICVAGDVPLIVDADHGYGNALNVTRTVALLDRAGIAALTLEDTDLPQPFNATGASLISIAAGVGKMNAALAGRQDDKLAVIARTSAILISGLDDAVTRIKAYSDCGVDAIALIGVNTKEDLEILCAATDLPIMLGGLNAELRDKGYLAELGVRICLTGHQPFMAAMAAAHDAMIAQRDDGKMPALATVENIQRWTADGRISSLADQVLRSND